MKHWFFKRAVTRRAWLVFWVVASFLIFPPLFIAYLVWESAKGAGVYFRETAEEIRSMCTGLADDIRRSWAR